MRIVSLLLVALLVALPAQADELQSLRDEVQKLRAQVPAAADALHTLENRVESLTQEVQRLSGAREAEPFVQKAIDELRDQVRTLEQRLAATQARVAEPAEPWLRFGYDDGVFLKTQPLRVLLNLAVMPRWIGVYRRGRANTSEFELHHGQLQLQGDILGFIEAQLMIDVGAEFLTTANVVRDAFVGVRATRWLRLRGGLFKVPFSRERLVNSFRLTFADRSLATRAFSFDRDLGGEAELTFLGERILVQLAVMNGVQAIHNDNVDLAYTLRVLGQPLGPLPLSEGDVFRGPVRFSIGAAFQYDLQPNDQKLDLDRDGVIDNLSVYSFNAEGAVHWRGLSAEGEYYLRVEQAGVGLPAHRYQGGYAQLSAMVWRGLQLGARFSYAQPHILGGTKLGVFGDQPRSAIETGGVVNYWVWREKVRGQVSYDYRRDVSLAVQQAHIVQVQLQAGF